MSTRLPQLPRLPDGTLRDLAPRTNYPLAYRDSEGEILCPDCAREVEEDLSDERTIDAGQILFQGPDRWCSDCGVRMGTAWGLDPA